MVERTALLPVLDGLFGGEACKLTNGKYITKWGDEPGQPTPNPPKKTDFIKECIATI